MTRREISRELSMMTINQNGETHIDWDADFESNLNQIASSSRQVEEEYNQNICLSDSSLSSVGSVEMIEEFHDAESYTTSSSYSTSKSSSASSLRSCASSSASTSTTTSTSTRRRRGRGKVTKKQKNEKKREYMREKRRSELYRELENLQHLENIEHHRQKKIDYMRARREIQRSSLREQITNTQAHIERRSDLNSRAQEQERNTEKRREKRLLDEDYRERERRADRARRTVANNSYKAISERYIRGTQEAADYVCVCCSGLFFRRTVIEFKEDTYKRSLSGNVNKARKNKSRLPYISFADLLDKLDMSLEDYNLALRASINTPTVFHRRTCHEIMVNPYNKSILLKHQANMDIQFVLNS